MTDIDLMKALNVPPSSFYLDLKEKVDKFAIINVHTISGKVIKIKGSTTIHLINIEPDYLTLQFDSHQSDIMFSAIEEIEYFGSVKK